MYSFVRDLSMFPQLVTRTIQPSHCGLQLLYYPQDISPGFPGHTQTTSAGAATGVGLSTVQVCFRPFWRRNPRTRFCQVEAQFHLRHITSKLTRYYHVVFHLPPELTAVLADVLAAPPSGDAYDHINGHCALHCRV